MNFAARFALFFMALLLWLGAAQAKPGPATHVAASLVSETTAIMPGTPFTVGLLLKMDPGWHIYWQHPGESGLPTEIAWNLPEGFSAGPISWPLPTAHLEDDFLTNVYEGEVLLMVEITPPTKLPSGDVTLRAKAAWQVCAKICIRGDGDVSLKLPVGAPEASAQAGLFDKWRAQLPKTTTPPAIQWDVADPKQIRLTVQGLAADATPEFFPLPPGSATPGHPTVAGPDAKGARSITIPVDPPAPAGAVWRGLLVTQKGNVREGWYVTSAAPAASVAPGAPRLAVAKTPVTVSSTPAGATPPPTEGSTPPASGKNTPTLLGALALAFFGGLILNIMPCVLPVIALKIFGFVKQAGQEPRRIFHLGLAFVAGVFAFFLTLATIAVVLHSSGQSLSWGAQFQNPYLLAGLIALIFVFSLNLLGVFEITLSGGATSTLSELSSREGLGGAFLHGMFTTLLGTSCTAPVMAVSVGYAVTQPAPIIYLLFVMLAAGMSLPYFLLTAVPGWMKYLPKPGVWMERFKQLTGFIMLAVVVWLYSVMAGSRPGAATNLSWYLFALGVVCWAMGAYQYRLVRWLIFPLVVIGGFFSLLQGPLAEASQAKGSDLTRRIADARKTGAPVFVDFTADWCQNCKAFEKAVLATKPVQAAFADKKVVTVVADWTNPDDEIKEWLLKFNRAGVPLYLLYRPGEKEPVVMDSVSTGGLLTELGKIQAK